MRTPIPIPTPTPTPSHGLVSLPCQQIEAMKAKVFNQLCKFVSSNFCRAVKVNAAFFYLFAFALVTALNATAACRSIKLTFILWIHKNTYEIIRKYLYVMYLYLYCSCICPIAIGTQRAPANGRQIDLFLMHFYCSVILFFFPSVSFLTQGKYASGWHNICIKVGF